MFFTQLRGYRLPRLEQRIHARVEFSETLAPVVGGKALDQPVQMLAARVTIGEAHDS